MLTQTTSPLRTPAAHTTNHSLQDQINDLKTQLSSLGKIVQDEKKLRQS